MRRFTFAFALVAVLAFSVINVAAGKTTGNKTGQICQKGKWQALIRATDGTGFSSETQCTSWVANHGTSSVLPISAQPCFNNGWQNLVRSDGTVFASQDACTSYASNANNVLYPKSEVNCLESGWILKSKTTGASVTSGTQACFDLLAANNLLGVKLTSSLNTNTNVVGWTVKAFGVAPGDNFQPFCSIGGQLTASEQFSTTVLQDPWRGGVECISATGIPIGADGLFSESGSQPCPPGATSVDQIGAVFSWSQSYEFSGSPSSGIGVGLSSGDFACPPAQHPDDHAPTAVDDNITVNAGGPTDITSILNNDTDPDSNQLRFAPSGYSQPSHGTLSVDEDFFSGTVDVQYTPDDSSATSDSFTYYVQDRGATSATPATVNITIFRN
jgi:hypothetical protein